MKSLIVLILLIPSAAFAAGSWDGTWKVRTSSIQVMGKPDVQRLVNGLYDCDSCIPPLKGIKADGSDQAVMGHDYYDQIAVKVLSPTSIQMVQKKGGKLMYKSTDTVSTDSNTLTVKFESFVGTTRTSGEARAKRVGEAIPGAHPVSGSWMQEQAELSDAGGSVILESTPNGLRLTWNGQTTDAKFDGKEVPIIGDPGHTMVSMKKHSDTVIEETDRRGGRVFDQVTYTLSADGMSISVVDEDPAHGTKTTYMMDKQPTK